MWHGCLQRFIMRWLMVVCNVSVMCLFDQFLRSIRSKKLNFPVFDPAFRAQLIIKWTWSHLGTEMRWTNQTPSVGRNEFNKTRPKYVLFTLWLMRGDHWIPVIHPLIHAGLMTYMCFPLVNRTDSDYHVFSQNQRRVTQPKVFTFPDWWFVRHHLTYTTWPPPWFARMLFTHPICRQSFIGIRIGFTLICPDRA